MDDERIDALARQLDIQQPRRLALGRGLAALFFLGIAASATKADARKRKKKRRRKKKQKKPTCAQSCPETCPACFNLPEGPPICAELAAIDCTLPCVSHNDCVGTGNPYCSTSSTDRASGTTTPWICPASDIVGRCILILIGC